MAVQRIAKNGIEAKGHLCAAPLLLGRSLSEVGKVRPQRSLQEHLSSQRARERHVVGGVGEKGGPCSTHCRKLGLIPRILSLFQPGPPEEEVH